LHVLLIEVEERNSEGKIPSILGKERGNMERILGLRRDGRRIVLVHQSEETYVWSQEVVIKVKRSHRSTRMDDPNVGVMIIDGLLPF
jgi:hypothetical protein